MNFARSLTILATSSIIAGCAVTATSITDQQDPKLLILANMNGPAMQRLKNVDGSSSPRNPNAIGEGYRYCTVSIESGDRAFISMKVNESLARLGFLSPRAQAGDCTLETQSGTRFSDTLTVIAISQATVPRMHASARDVLSRYTRIGEVSGEELRAWRQSIIEKEKVQSLERENRLKKFRELAKTAPNDYLTSLSIGVSDKGYPKYCTTEHQRSSFALISEYSADIFKTSPEMYDVLQRYPIQVSRRVGGPPDKRFDTVYHHINSLFAKLHAGEDACHILIDYPDRILILLDAIADAQLQVRLDVGVPVPVATLQDSLAKKEGFTDGRAWQFGTAVGINQNTVSRFMGLGIDSAVKYKEAQASMERESYSSSKQPGELLQYLTDRAQAKNGESAVLVRQARMENQAKELRERQEARQRELERQKAEKQRQEEERVREAKRKRDEILRNNKYMAVLTCEFGNRQLTLMVCMSGPMRGGLNGEIEMRSQSGYRLYQYHEVYQIPGFVDGRLEIPFNSPFTIRAQNSSNDYKLSLRIIENSTGRRIWERSVSSLGTLNFRQ